MTNNRMIAEAWRKAKEYGVSVVYGEKREISVDFESWTMEAVIRTDADLPDAISSIESSTWPEMCKAHAWA